MVKRKVDLTIVGQSPVDNILPSMEYGSFRHCGWALFVSLNLGVKLHQWAATRRNTHFVLHLMLVIDPAKVPPLPEFRG